MSQIDRLFDSLEPRRLLSGGAGGIDPAFNGGAPVSISIPGGSAVVTDMQTLGDGGILAVGVLRARSGSNSTGQSELAIAKFNFDGSLDSGFGDGGTVATTARGLTGAIQLELSPDGGFFVMGSDQTYASGLTAVSQGSETILKFTAAGKVDSSFGNNGALKLGDASTFAVDPVGRILAGGFSEHADQRGVFDATLTRYTATGALDTRFNKSGAFIAAAGSLAQGDSLSMSFSSIAIDASGEIFAGVTAHVETASTSGTTSTIYRLTDAGKIDRSYASNGKRAIAGYEVVGRVLEDGSAILVGDKIVRLLPSGNIDNTYGTLGFADAAANVFTPTSQLDVREPMHSFAVNEDGAVVYVNPSVAGTLQLKRIAAGGHLDTDFGASGISTLVADADPDAQDFLQAIVEAPDGSIVAGGQTGILSSTGKTDTRAFGLARVLSITGPALQLIPRTLKTSTRYMSMNVLIRDADGINVSSLDNSDLKLFDADGHTRKIRLLNATDVLGDGTYLRATYRIIGPGSRAWSSASNGTYEVRLQRQQVFDSAGNNAAAQVLGVMRVKIA